MIYYPKSTKKHLLAFGNLNNEYFYFDEEQNDNLLVPIEYVAKEKRIAFENSIRDNISSISLPKMAFELVSIDYDEERKKNTVNNIISVDGTEIVLPLVPYIYTIDMGLWTRTEGDLHDINEQIVYKFKDVINYPLIHTKFNDNTNIVLDVPIQLVAVSTNSQLYDIDAQGEVIIQYNYTFTVKGWMLPVLRGISQEDFEALNTGETYTGNIISDNGNWYVGNKIINKIDFCFENENDFVFEEFTVE